MDHDIQNKNKIKFQDNNTDTSGLDVNARSQDVIYRKDMVFKSYG
jgi:hypothetical protein